MDCKINIRFAERTDMMDVMTMIQELADYEEMSDGPQITAEILERDAFDSSPPLFRCYVAEAKNDIDSWLIGYAIFFNTYSTWEGKSLMLEDIYIKPDCRMLGAGKKMFATIAKFALDTGCCRVDFHVLQWNNARKFYELIGASNLTDTEDWMFYRLSGNALLKLSQITE